MNSGESTFTLHQFPIVVQALNEPVYLIPFGDIHRYARLCDVEQWQEFLEWAKRKKNTYFLGMGDYDDLCSFSERKALNDCNLHEETRYTLDEIYQQRVNNLVKELKFMEGKLIGLIEGNHFGAFQSGITTTQMMCDKLKCKYLGGSAVIGLNFVYGSKRASLDIYAHHGRGASRLVGGSLNSVQQMMDIVECDIYLQGHDHKKSVAMKSKLKVSRGHGQITLSKKKVLMGRTGSFLLGYVDGVPSYVARAMMSPTDLGTLKLIFTAKRHKKGGNDSFYIDIHSSL